MEDDKNEREFYGEIIRLGMRFVSAPPRRRGGPPRYATRRAG
jgi:hypothetical protein